MDLRCILCTVNSSYAVKTPKDEVAIHNGIFLKTEIFGDVSLRTGDFKIEREDRKQPLKMGGLEHMENVLISSFCVILKRQRKFHISE